MDQSRQTPQVRSDAIRGPNILANWFKLGSGAVVLLLSMGGRILLICVSGEYRST